MRFESPLYFLLLLVLPAIYFILQRRQLQGFIRHSSVKIFSEIRPSFKVRFRWLPNALRILALTLIVIALSRPQEGREKVNDFSKGIAIEMVVDRSSSMRAPMEFDGERMTRLDAVKKVFDEFVVGNGRSLKGRKNDLVGLIAFARYADTVCPLTLGHDGLVSLGKKVRLVQQRSEDGTSIGDALALAAARLRKSEETLKKRNNEQKANFKIKSKIIILLTDGVNNNGKVSPLQAAELAKEWGIKVYSIGVGEKSRSESRNVFDMLTGNRGDVDTELLSRIADSTGGKFNMVSDADELRQVYAEIDTLEKSEVESVRFLDYKEKFTPWAAAAFCAVVLEILLSCTIFRRVP
jgi:Ca-activated chloride channel family protein